MIIICHVETVIPTGLWWIAVRNTSVMNLIETTTNDIPSLVLLRRVNKIWRRFSSSNTHIPRNCLRSPSPLITLNSNTIIVYVQYFVWLICNKICLQISQTMCHRRIEELFRKTRGDVWCCMWCVSVRLQTFSNRTFKTIPQVSFRLCSVNIN